MLTGSLLHAAPAAAAPLSSVAMSAFQIGPQPLSNALIAFGMQSGWQLSVPNDLVAKVRSPGVSGTVSPETALTALLAGTGLTWQITGPRSATVRKASSTITLGPVRVGGTLARQDPTGPGVGYVAETTMAGTKTNTPITEIPNSIYVITKQQMVDQQPQNITDALRYTPGIYAEAYGGGSTGAAGSLNGQIFQRGFKAWQFVDGLMTHSASAGETTFLERIEAVNGPASVMYGQITPGGMIGMSLKKPTDTPLHQVSIGFGNWGRYEATVDLSDKITKNGNLRYRVAAIGVTQGTQVNYVDYHRVGVLPSITWDIDPKTSLTLMGMYMYTPGDGSNGTGLPVIGTRFTDDMPRIPRSTFIGEPNWNQSGEKDAMFEYQFKHQFKKYINFSQTFRWEDTNFDKLNAYYDSNVSPGVISVSPWQNQITANQEALDTRFYGIINTGPIQHTWVVGNDFRYYSYKDTTTFDDRPEPTLNVYNPQYQYEPCYSMTSDRCNVFSYSPNSSYFQEGVYFQDQIKWKNISVILGGRQDWAHQETSTTSSNNSNGTTESYAATKKGQSDKEFTWRGGVVYNTKFGLHPYFSYSTSFIPQTGQTNYLGQPFSPLTGKQLEAGLKYKVPNRDILFTASAFDIVENHYLIDDMVHTNFSKDAGTVKSRGFEVSANANITKSLKVVASYTFEDVRFGKSTNTDQIYYPFTDSYGAYVSEKGKFVPYIPRNMFNVFADYTFRNSPLSGFGVNGGVRYVGFTYSDNVESYKVPSYFLFDIGAHYDFGSVTPTLRGLKAQLAISNLTNKYYASGCNTNLCYLGQGRRVYGNLTYSW
ncbi:TonB-dependent siderophore receptor [Gluconacetobacter sp.]|uniref:TonB-dependent siderophore receptor n=1 Tax=Gluconacetobacter sp. TaxID=1935994 RepID=UPI0039EC421F